MQALIIAAGQGTRLSGVSESKPLTPVAGVPLVERIIRAAAGAGVDGFVVVTGYNAEPLERFLADLSARLGVDVVTVRNDEWRRENGLSVLRARGEIGEPFLLMMADHLCEAATMRRMAGQPIDDGEVILAVDRRVEGHPFVDMDDVTRVLEADGRIVSIGKALPRHNAFDTGLFLCTTGIFAAIEESAASGDCSLSGGMRLLAARGKARTMDIGDAFWLDVDDEPALAKAERRLGSPEEPVDDGAPPRSAPRGRRGRAVEVAFNVLGLALLVHLVRSISLETIGGNLSRFGAGYAVIMALALGWLALGTLAWRLVQGRISGPVPFRALFSAKLASEALNTLLPAMNIGGELARAHLVRRHVPLLEGIPGVVVDKTLDFGGGIAFMIVGFLAGLLFLDLPTGTVISVSVLLAVSLVAVVLFGALQFTGFYRWILALSAPLPRLRRFLVDREAKFRLIDDNFRLIHEGGWRLLLPLGLYVAARAMGVLEVLVISVAIGGPGGVLPALFVSTLVTAASTAFFFVPGQWGVAEGAHVVALASLGYSGPVGLSIGIIRRIRRLGICLLGMVLYYAGRAKARKAAPAAAGRPSR